MSDTRAIRKVKSPILIVGVGRSGTTLLYEILARHPDVGWFSTLTDRWPSVPQLAAVSNVHRLRAARRLGGRWVPNPAEGYRLWANPRPLDDGPLDETDANDAEIRRVNRVVRSHLRHQGKRRFINKNTRNTRCVRYLDAVFDDALFVHVLRDPRAVVASLLRVAFWPDLRIWCEGGITPREWESQGRDPVELAARLWAADVQRARADGRVLPSGRYLEIHYEDLVADPTRVLQEVSRFGRLDSDPDLPATLAEMRPESRNDKYRSAFSPEQLRVLENTVAEVAAGCGYAMVPAESRRPSGAFDALLHQKERSA